MVEAISEAIEITEPRELVPNEEVKFVVKKEAPTVFYFEVTESTKITIDSWELVEDQYSNTDIYITVNDENVSKDNYHWKVEYGVDKIDIYPDDEKYALGLYRVAFYTASDDPGIAIKLSFSQFIPSVSLNELDAPLQAQCETCCFFEYKIQDFSNLFKHLFLLNVSNRTKL